MEKNSQNPNLVRQCKNLPQDSRPMLPLKTLDIINRRRYVRNTQYYFTNRKHAVQGKSPEVQSRSFRMPSSEKLLSYLRYTDKKRRHLQKHLLRKPIYLKDNLRFADTRNISSRLYLEDPKDDVKTVLKIHPEFYNVIEGRPVRAMEDIKLYIKSIRDYAMLRQQIGYRGDMILQIEKSMREETKDYENIMGKLKVHIMNFQKFLTEDYKKAQQKVSEAEKVVKSLILVNSELLTISSSLTILNNLIFKLDSIRNVLKMYQKYLMFVSPLIWRKQYDASLQTSASEEFVNTDDLVEVSDLDNILKVAQVELQKPCPIYMYFKHPQEMLYLFRTMELQSREYLIQLSKTDLPYRMLRERIKQLKMLTSMESDFFQYNINYFKNAIDRELFNETYLQKKFYRILTDNFFDSVASPDTLKLRICINFVYQEIFGKLEEEFEKLIDPMRILELLYEEYNLKTDKLDFKIVNEARNENFAHDLKMMLKAHQAQRELKSFWEMTNSMNRAFLPPAKFSRPILKKFIKRKDELALARAEKKRAELERGLRVKSKKKKVTPEQLECLLLFTDWTEGLNPQPFLKEYETYVKPVFDETEDE